MDEERMIPYKILKEGGQGEIEEKKSRFIATLRRVESEEEAAAFIEETKKKYWDARHNCSAFVIGKKAELTRCSDDGEPSGTAGRPMLEVLLGEEVRNAAVVVTRYFGGTLLGTGGLVRAYTQAVKAGLHASRIVTMRYGVRMKMETDYNGLGKIQYILGNRNIPIEDSRYTENVVLTALIPQEEYEVVCKEITEATAGKSVLTKVESLYYECANDCAVKGGVTKG
ncbi:MAG: YigZ family protein [Clostridiales bacterium]|nr:YigZ family protein [Clostridiales bacterium]